jgi:hypothetical protein
MHAYHYTKSTATFFSTKTACLSQPLHRPQLPPKWLQHPKSLSQTQTAGLANILLCSTATLGPTHKATAQQPTADAGSTGISAAGGSCTQLLKRTQGRACCWLLHAAAAAAAGRCMVMCQPGNSLLEGSWGRLRMPCRSKHQRQRNNMAASTVSTSSR